MLWTASVPGVICSREASGTVIRTVCDGDITIQGVEEQPGAIVRLQQCSDHVNVLSMGLQMAQEQFGMHLRELEGLFSSSKDLFVGFLSVFLQMAVEVGRLDLVEKLAQQSGNSRMGDLARSLRDTPLPSILASLQAKPERYRQDLSNLLQAFYYSKFQPTALFPYSLFQFAETNHSSWILHGLATICDVGIRVVYWDCRTQKMASSWIYPNTETRHVQWLYLFKNFYWSMHNPSPSTPHSDLNLWPVLRDLQSINHLPTMREFESYTGPLAQLKSDIRLFDLVLARALTHLHSQLYCAFCSLPASVLSPCGHGFCVSCVSEAQFYSCPVCPSLCFQPSECYMGQVLEKMECCGACWKWFPPAKTYPGDPCVQALHRLPVCGHTCCSFCIEVRLRSDRQTCPLCPKLLPLSIEQASEVKLVCSACKEDKEWLADCELAVCRDHRICALCIATVETTNCPVCVQPFLASTAASALNFNTIRCSACSRLTCNSDLYRSNFCRCEVCVTCLCEVGWIGVCKKCERVREAWEVLKVYCFVLSRWKEVILSQQVTATN